MSWEAGFTVSPFPSHCGSAIFHSFNWGKRAKYNSYMSTEQRTAFAIFINRSDQKMAYEYLKRKFKILYQSPILTNPGTSREYFIVIYLNKKP